MEIGDVVMFEERLCFVRGIDSDGVPEYVHLEDARTGRRLTVIRARIDPGQAAPPHLRVSSPAADPAEC